MIGVKSITIEEIIKLMPPQINEKEYDLVLSFMYAASKGPKSAPKPIGTESKPYALVKFSRPKFST